MKVEWMAAKMAALKVAIMVDEMAGQKVVSKVI